MPVDKVELAKDLENPEYQQVVKDTLSKKEFVVRSKDEETTFQTNFKKDVIEKEIPAKIAEVHSMYDKDVEAITGMKRDQNEKSYDFVKRTLTHFKNDSSADLKLKVTELERQIAKGDGSGATAQALKDAETKYQTSLKEKDDLIVKLQGETSNTKKESLLTSAYANVKKDFKTTLPAMFSHSEKAILSDILRTAVVADDGKLYVGDGNGGIKKDAAFNPVSVEAQLRAEFKEVIAPPAKGGAGSGGNPNPVDPNAVTVENFTFPETVKSAPELLEYMATIGLKKGSELFNNIWTKYRTSFEDGKGMIAPVAPAKK